MMALEPQGFITLDHTSLEYRWIAPTQAGRPCLVMLHEGLGCVGLWRDFPDRLAASTGCGVFVYSRAGYGASSPVTLPRPLTYMHHEGLAVLPALLDQLDLGPVILFGHSDGGSIAIIHAGSVRARQVVGCVLLAAHVFNEDICVASIASAADAYRDGDLRGRLARWHGANVDCAFWGWNRAWLDPGFRRWNIEAFLPGLLVPALVIQGRDDEYGTARQYEAIAAKAGGPVETLVLDACGHSPHRDQPDAVLAATLRFVENSDG